MKYRRKAPIWVRKIGDVYLAAGPLGSGRCYSGEDAKVIELVLRYSK